MGVPTSEVGYNSAMPRREDHQVRKGHVGHGGGGTSISHKFLSIQVTDIFIIVFTKALIMKSQLELDQPCTKPRTLLHEDPFLTRSLTSFYASVNCLFHAGYQFFFLQIPPLAGVILSLPNAHFLIFGLCNSSLCSPPPSPFLLRPTYVHACRSKPRSPSPSERPQA